MSRALLDTNIIIHRENIKPTNYSIGQLFYWLDKLNYEKVIHPLPLRNCKNLKIPICNRFIKPNYRLIL